MGNLLLANLFSAFFGVYLGAQLQRFEPVLIMWLTAFGTMLWFAGACWKKPQRIKRILTQQPRLVFLYNISTLFAWLPWYFAIQALEPAVAQTISLALTPIVTILLTPWIHKGTALTRTQIGCAIAAVIGVLFLGLGSAKGYSGVGSLPFETVAFGFGNAVLVGLGVVGNIFIGKKFSQRGFAIREILATRFFLLLGLSIPLIDNQGGFASQPSAFWLVAFLSITGGSIAPLYLLQKGLEKVEPVVFSLLLVMVPAMVYLIQLFDPRLKPSASSLFGISICLIATAITVKSQRQIPPTATPDLPRS